MKKSSYSVLRGLAALSLCLVFGLARAQDQDYGPPDADPPDRAARLSLIRGDVSLQPAGEEEWAAAVLNRPLTTGDKLWTNQGARAEIEVGQAEVRLDSNTGFSFLNVDDNTTQMRITSGVINVSVRALAGNEQIEIDTPNLALTVLRPGTYRVEVNDAGDATVVKVSEGEAQVTGGGQDVIVHDRQVATFRGADQLTAQFGSLGAPDEFDTWSLERDRRDEYAASSETSQYVSPDVTGYEDLNDNGTWSSEPEYGYVWTPRYVGVGWSPYSYGRWSYIGPWGWTWIDDAPWGYAPFHYGRWAHVRERWCWVPGPRHVRAVYAPALVGWTGHGHGVAWFPLGPREVYVPARRYSHRYLERVNVSNTSIVNRTYLNEVYNHRGAHVAYRNRNVPGAVTAVSRETFTSAERVAGRRIRLDEQQSAGAAATAMAPRIEPVRESRLGMSETARRHVRVPPQAVVDRQVTVKREPPPAVARFARNPNTRDDVNREATLTTARYRAREQPITREAQRTHDDRPPQATLNTDRSARTNQPQVDELVRRMQEPNADRWVSPNRSQQQERPQQAREQQERRQAELRQRLQYEQAQLQDRERTTRQQDQRQQEVVQQARERQREVERPHVERPQVERPRVERPQPERQNRPEPQRSTESNPQPQRQQDHQERRTREYQHRN